MQSTDKEPADLDAILRNGWLHPADGFDRQVLNALPVIVHTSVKHSLWHWLSVIGIGVGGLFSAGQVLRFVFGVWIASAAG